MRKIHIIIVLLLSCIDCQLDCQAQVLFPGLTGTELLNAVQDNYTPNLNLNYAEARDILYGEIDVRDDSVRCVYTEFAVYLTPNTDPSSTLFDGGINTEHIYPQGRGATDGTPAHRNMHHLAASRVNVNSDRANLPFADISDNATDNWYYQDQKMSNIPTNNIDFWTEGNGLNFEPRESYKGNIARAMFYVHAIYRDQVMDKDPTFFAMQQADLCAWHFEDPVDTEELTRTQQIAVYQDQKENPFVLDCTLAERMYCSGVGECMVSVSNENPMESGGIRPYFDQSNRMLILENTSDQAIESMVSLFSIQGELIFSDLELNLSPREQEIIKFNASSGAYFLRVNENNKQTFVHQLILHN